MVGSQMQICSRNGSHTPFSLGGEGLPLIVGGGSDNNFISMFVDSSCSSGSDLTLLLGLLLYLGYLLPLLGGSADLHTQNDISDLRLCQTSHIDTTHTHTHTHNDDDKLLQQQISHYYKKTVVCTTKLLCDILVLLAIVSQDEVLECHLHTYPLLISKGGPDVVRLSNGGLVWLQDDLGSISVDMECSQDQNEPREGLHARVITTTAVRVTTRSCHTYRTTLPLIQHKLAFQVMPH